LSEEICHFCTLFDSNIFYENGKFDEDFVSFGGEVKLFNFKCSLKDISSIMALDIFVHHNGNTTSDSMSRDFMEDFKERDSLYEKRKTKISKQIRKMKSINTKMSSGELRVLFVRDNGIGDIIMLLFAAAWIKKQGKDNEIVFAIKSDFMEFISRFDCVDRVIPLSEEDISSFKLHEYKINEIYDKKFDIIFNFIDYFEIKNKNEKTHRIEQAISFIRDSYLECFKSIYPVIPKYEISLKDYDNVYKKIDKNIESLVGIAPMGTCGIRSMDEEVLKKIIKQESQFKKVVILGKDEIDIESEYINSENVINLTGKTNLEEIPPIVKMCEYVYTPDSGVFHIAGILEVPCRAFFGSIPSDVRDGFYKSSDKNLIYNKNLSCSPCWDVGCSSIECMKYTDEEIDLIVSGKKLENGK
jgi:ADP-heptose:LPS heptosyltransferase